MHGDRRHLLKHRHRRTLNHLGGYYRDDHGRLTDRHGLAVNGLQLYHAYGHMGTGTVVAGLSIFDRIPSRRHRVSANIVWSQGLAILPNGEKLSAPLKVTTANYLRGVHRRAPRHNALRRRGSRRFSASSSSGGGDPPGDPEPPGVALPRRGRQHKVGARVAG
jgi:hypothetical protein